MEPAAMTYRAAIQRIADKIRYAENRANDFSLPERTRHFSVLDHTALLMAKDALQYLYDLQQYEASASKQITKEE